jgi:hypothetical protein
VATLPIPRPTDVTDLRDLAPLLDEAGHEARVAWIRSLNRRQQYALYALARGNPVKVDELVRDQGQVVRHIGRNGLLMFSLFEKRFARMGDGVVGYNQDEFPGLLRGIAVRVTGPGHFVAYDSPEVPGEVWIDYRSVRDGVPSEFPPVRGNESGLPALVFGDLVDVLRRVSKHVFIGDSFKGKYPRPDRPPFLARVGGWLPTAPFVLCQAT